MAGIYCADIYCDDCIEDIKRRIAMELQDGNNDSCMAKYVDLSHNLDVDEIVTALDYLDERDYDSNEYPKYCDDSAESDSPQHCASCFKFLENDLTTDGIDYTRKMVQAEHLFGDCPVECNEIAAFYDYIDYGNLGHCEECDNLIDCDEGCDYCNIDLKEDEPIDGDFTITPTGPLGGKSGLGRVNGKFVGEYDCDEDAANAAYDIMEDESFWPNIWIVSDHGNWAPLWIRNNPHNH